MYKPGRTSKKIPNRLPLRLRLRSGWPALIWVAAALVCIPLLLRKSNWQMAERIHGVVGRETIVIAPEETARVLRILVGAGQTVTNGQPLVEMDTVSIEHELAETLLDAYRTAHSINQQQTNMRDDVARRGERVAEAEKDLEECRMDQSAEKAELNLLGEIQAQRDEMRADGLLDDRGWREYQPRMVELKERIDKRETLLRLYEQQLAEARKWHEEAVTALKRFEEDNADSDYAGTMLARIEEETKRYRDSYILRSPAIGVISEVRSEEGEVVRADDTVLRVVPTSLSTVVALVPEELSTQIQPMQRVWVTALNDVQAPGRSHLPAVVESLSNEIRTEAALVNMTGRLIPMRSRRAILRLDHPEKSGLIAGEVVEVQLTAPGTGWLHTLKKHVLGGHG